jgi:hypothetical protein
MQLIADGRNKMEKGGGGGGGGEKNPKWGLEIEFSGLLYIYVDYY